MADPFAEYANKARIISTRRVVPLVGDIKTRRAAREAYIEITQELAACEDADQLEAYLASISGTIAQFRAEIHHWWHGDGFEFPGLKGEIEAARARLSLTQDDEFLRSLNF